MHIHDKKIKHKGPCIGCLMGRSSAKTGRPARPEDLAPTKNNERLAADFVGPWPTSRFGST